MSGWDLTQASDALRENERAMKEFGFLLKKEMERRKMTKNPPGPKTKEVLAEEYANRFKGLTQPDGSEGDPTICDLEFAYVKGYDTALTKALRVIEIQRAALEETLGNSEMVLKYQSWGNAADIVKTVRQALTETTSLIKELKGE